MTNPHPNADSDPEADHSKGGGLFATLKNLAATLLSSGRTRLELLGNEIEAEKLRAMHLLLMAQAMVFCFGVGVLLAVAWLTALFWESRTFLLAGFAVLFIVLGSFFWRTFQRTAQRSEPVFASSLAELEEDLRQLKAAARHERTPD